MKKNYIQPVFELLTVKSYNVCQATSYTVQTGDPISGDPNEGR